MMVLHTRKIARDKATEKKRAELTQKWQSFDLVATNAF